jgi:molybdate transport system substrate-binding protein
MTRFGTCLKGALLVALCCFGPPAGSASGRLDLYVAASLTDVASEIAEAFEAETGVSSRIVPAASSTLARQIAAGAPADVFLSADPQWTDWLVGQGIGDLARRKVFAGNRLVIVSARADADADALYDPASTERIAIADPDHVPAGRYARQVLEVGGRWKDVAGRLVPAANVREALRLAETGQTAYAIVYATDATAGRVRTLATLPDPDPPIRYVAMALGDDQASEAFVMFLRDAAAETILCRNGFRLIEGRKC